MNEPNLPPISPSMPTPQRPLRAEILTRPTATSEIPLPPDRGGPEAADPRTAIERVVAYLAQLGVGSEVALRLANTLDARIDPGEIDPARRTAAMLEVFDRWQDELPAKLELPEHADRVAFVAAMHLGRLLNQHPEALDDPAGLVASMRPLLEERPHGVLPNWPRQKMHRQPLGELPAVLQGEFWSGTYRWVVPVGASTKRLLRGHKKMMAESNPTAHPPVAVEGHAAGE